MATMVKEKPKEKKKRTKEKKTRVSALASETDISEPYLGEKATNSMLKQLDEAEEILKDLPDPAHAQTDEESHDYNNPQPTGSKEIGNQSSETIRETPLVPSSEDDCVEDIKTELENMIIIPVQKNIENTLSQSPNLASYEYDTSLENSPQIIETITEDVLPSAPTMKIEVNTAETLQKETVKVKKAKLPCMSLEETIRLFGAREIMEVTEMSEREEQLVEAGPSVGAYHPLIDLLHTLRCSLSAVERERVNLARGYAEEAKSRTALWKVEKRHFTVSEQCHCGADVTVKVTYEHAELMKNKLPAAKVRLEGLQRNVQESYCHHQHAAMLAHWQIEDLIFDTINRGKPQIRTALSLILQELRLSETGSEAICGALRRWARALTAALLGNRDPRHLLFLMHHLFRQSRSVQWAAKLVSGVVTAGDISSACAAVALLDVTLGGGRATDAHECIEEMEETWEELDKRGEGGAVLDGSLRERDLLALFQAFPTRDIVARLALIRHQDITQAVDYEWGDASGGRGVLKSVCGARTLLAVLQRAVLANARYERLTSELVMFGEQTAWAMADLHEHTRSTYSFELRDVITRELEACFAAVFNLVVSGGSRLRHLPFRLLAEDSCEIMADTVIACLHDSTPKKIEDIDIELPSKLTCGDKVHILTAMAVDRTADCELARKILEFLFQTGIKKKQPNCKNGCESAARESISALLAHHTYLYPAAITLLIESDHDNIESSIHLLSPGKWRPDPSTATTVLTQCVRAPRSVPALLLAMDFTPYTGISLETQLSIASWLSDYHEATFATNTPEWCWTVLRRLALHRAWWALPLLAGAAGNAKGLFEETLMMLGSEVSHQVPLICEYAVRTLERLARAGRIREAVHCLGPVMLVMAQSPESVTYTPKFTEVCGLILEAGPTLLQRAIGRDAPCGQVLLQRLVVAQIQGSSVQNSQQAVFATWLRALWAWPAGRAVLEAAVCAGVAYELPAHIAGLMQEQDSQEILSSAVRHVGIAPTLCWGCTEAAVGAAGSAGSGGMASWPRLLDALHARRRLSERAHVDNTLKLIGWPISSDDLVIHRVAAALLAAPLAGPAHLLLWTLFFHLYLQRPPSDMRETTPPVGPIFFSGIIKSRTMAQLKRRLQETYAYHMAEKTRCEQEAAILERINKIQNPTEVKEDKPTSWADGFLPPLTLGVEESDSSEDENGGNDSSVKSEKGGAKPGEQYKLRGAYHGNIAAPLAERFLSWLEEGESVRATPNHESLLLMHSNCDEIKAAWEAELQRTTSPASPLDGTLPPFPPPPPDASPPTATPLQRVVDRLTKYRNGKKRRSKVPVIKSPLEGVVAQDQRTLLRLLDRQLREVELIAKEWSSEVSRLSRLDEILWHLVGELRVRRPAPPLRRACANSCKPITLVVPVEEWCISTRTERALEENREQSRAALSRLARPRPHAAATAAAIQYIIRQVRDTQTACDVARRLRCCGGDGGAIWASVASSLAELCEKYMSNDASICAEFLSGWKQDCLQRAASGALVNPRRLRNWSVLYTDILNKDLSASEAFSCLSKFEPNLLSSLSDSNERREAIKAVTAAVKKHGASPDQQYQVLLELLGVHTVALTTPQELSDLIMDCARASAAANLPPTHWAHVLKAIEMYAPDVTFDQLGHTLSGLGGVWWEARSKMHDVRGEIRHATHATHMASVLHALTHVFVDAALDQHCAMDRVAWYAWSATQESWSPWIRPQLGVPLLLPAGSEAALALMQKFLNQLRGIMESCVGCEPYIYQELFEWTAQIVVTSHTSRVPQDFQIQLSMILAEELKMDWSKQQWFSARCMQTLVQLSSTANAEALSWACSVLRQTSVLAWLAGVPQEHLAPHLAALLAIFNAMPFSDETIEEATKLPWWRLPTPALENVLECFFAERHSASQAYHELPCFKLILYASELSVHPTINTFAARGGASEKRLSFISFYIRSLSHPSLQAHVGKGTRCLLDTITRLAPYVETSQGELESLLGRAITILCTEPAGTNALPVWMTWVSSAPIRSVAASLSALAELTSFDQFAVLADVAVKAYMLCDESLGWPEVMSRWAKSHWRSSGALVARGRLHAAYALAVNGHAGHAHAVFDTPPLHTVSIDFVKSEVIVAAWICLLCRRGAGATIAAWAMEPRRSLLRAITGQNSDRPTNKHRLLCRLAQCILTPASVEAKHAFENYLPTVLGSQPGGATDWVAQGTKALPLLAMKLFPKEERYFRLELDFASLNVI